MSDVISEYARWKQKGEALRAKARQAMEARFRDLLLEAVNIAEDYKADFGGTLKPPPPVTAFRYKARPKTAKRTRAAAKPPRMALKAEQPPTKPDPRIARLRKRLETARKKLELARAAGEPTQNLEDKVYEIEDDLQQLSGDQQLEDRDGTRK